jgi:acyl-CoA thioesterase FadM
VHTEADFKAPLRYGDTARIEAGIAKLGETSCNMRYRVVRARDAVLAATIEHVTVASDLVQMTKLRLPDDVRAALAPHLLA